MEDIETIMQIINGCNTSIDLEKIVSNYLMAISEVDNSHGETYIETAQRLGGNKILELANAKLLELDIGWHD